MTSQKQFKLTLVRSLSGRKPGHAETLRGLGLTRIHQSRVVSDTPENRGMVNKVRYLLQVEEA